MTLYLKNPTVAVVFDNFKHSACFFPFLFDTLKLSQQKKKCNTIE